MTQVMVETQELQLVNIVQVVQTSLVKNFTLLLKKLNRHENCLAEHAQLAERNLDASSRSLLRLEDLILLQERTHSELVQQLSRRIAALEDANSASSSSIQNAAVGLKRVNDELFNTQLQFEQKIKIKEKEVEEIKRSLTVLTLEQSRLNDEINKKENKVEAERIIKETEMLKDKHAHFENELRVAHHKIEKIEILNQKAQRLQAKKDNEIIKEIEDRVKKEFRASVNTSSPAGSFSNIQNPGQANQTAPTNVSHFYNRKDTKQQQQQDIPRRPSILGQDQIRNSVQLSVMAGESLVRSNVESIIEKWSQKIKSFQVQLREIHQNLKVLNRPGAHKRTDLNKENNTEGIKDKINEIKPEVIKLWAKLDTLEDRMGFNERRLEERMRNINDLTNVIKENNVSKLEEKLKNLQTEVFTSLKEVKSKLETRVGQTEYDKFRQQIDEKTSQINDMIYLKSDKLEVKKALLFLQSKIKEIILVISEDEENEKDALLTKKQLKCISCDKELDKFAGTISSPKGNWDNMPFKDHPPEILGRFGMTSFGSLAKKIKKLEGKDLPLLNKKSVNQSFQTPS